MLSRLSGSLSFRLMVIFLLLGGLFVFGTFKAVQIVYNSDDIRGLISGHLSLHVNYVREDIGIPPRIDRAIAITQRVPVDIRILGPDVDWASDPAFPRLDQLEFAPSPRFSNDPDAWVDELKGVEFAELDNHDFLRMHQGGYDIVVATPRIADMPEGPDLVTLILGMGLASLLLGYMSVRWLFKPIRAIRQGAAEIGRGNFEHRIRNIRRDQLGDLATDINRMADDVEDMLDAKRALLLGISHELRTPLSRMRLTLEFLDDEKIKSDLRDEIIEMEKIVAALLEAERLNSRHARLARTGVIVGDLVGEILEDFFAREKDRIKVSQPAEAITANLDEARITLLLKNLLGNALRYSEPSDGPVELSVATDDADLVFNVRDYGPGLPQDQASQIGEPFYRGDPSRTRDSGGTGLGLYLASLVARAHGGSLRLLDVSGKGASFETRIPLV
ncbi:MAG: HAMP domain-containing histidine kinase [Gammaproteobacteria bacterium]|nr:HAMP domain-containing histidine kinase [Gammaproteobacteria bacterium]MDH3430820.1 HAMP domain-containing histidine kinase [Gammaproteobacteria bacterium]MDH3432978.1 HAMP domain-containing histidine kinase [Gammaproteobacteria bacterium]